MEPEGSLTFYRSL